MKEKNFGSKGKYFIFYENIGKIIKFLTLAKMSQNIFAYFSVSEHSASFLRPGGSPPPPSRLRTDPQKIVFLRLP